MNMQEKDIFELDSFKSLSEYEKTSVKHQYENYVKMKELGKCFLWLYITLFGYTIYYLVIRYIIWLYTIQGVQRKSTDVKLE